MTGRLTVALSRLRSAAKQVGWVTVGGAVAHSTAVTKPDVRLSPHPAPQHTSLIKSTPLKAITRLRSLAHERSGSRLASGLQSACASVIRLEPILPPCLLVYRPHVSISSALPEALASWGIPLHQGIRPGRLLSRGENPDGLLRSVCPFSVTLGRYSTPCPLYVSSGDHAPRYSVAEWGHVPFGPACVCLRNHQPVWQVLTHDASGIPLSPVHSHLLEASPLSASSLSPSRPCTPPCVRQTHNVGRRCYSSTWRVGVDQLPKLIAPTWIHSCKSSGSAVSPPFPAHPPCWLAWFRANGSHSAVLGRLAT